MALKYWAKPFKTAAYVRNRIKIEGLNEKSHIMKRKRIRSPILIYARIWLRMFRSYAEGKTQQVGWLSDQVQDPRILGSLEGIHSHEYVEWKVFRYHKCLASWK
jgi:hypothetical protein